MLLASLHRVIKKSLCTSFCNVIIRCTETFWSPCIYNYKIQTLPSFACSLFMPHKYRMCCIEKHTANSSIWCVQKMIVFTLIFWTSDIKLLNYKLLKKHRKQSYFQNSVNLRATRITSPQNRKKAPTQ